MPSEWASARAPSTASGEQQALAPSVSGSAQSFSVTPTTSAPRSRSSSAATALSTPPDIATSDAVARPAGASRSGRSGGAAPAPGAARRRRAAPHAAWPGSARRSPRRPRRSRSGPPRAPAPPSTISATAAVAARVAPQPSASKVDRRRSGPSSSDKRDPREIAAGSPTGGPGERRRPAGPGRRQSARLSVHQARVGARIAALSPTQMRRRRRDVGRDRHEKRLQPAVTASGFDPFK